MFNFRLPRDGFFPPRHRIDPDRVLTAFRLDATAMTAQMALQGIPFHPLTSMTFSHAPEGASLRSSSRVTASSSECLR
jgi:hypothetical protein